MRSRLIAQLDVAALCQLPAGGPSPSSRDPRSAVTPTARLRSSRASPHDTGVPADLLAAVSYTETRFSFVHRDPTRTRSRRARSALTDQHARICIARLARRRHRRRRAHGLRGIAPRGRRAAADYASANRRRLHAGLRASAAIRSRARSSARSRRGIDGRDDAGARFVVAARPMRASPVAIGGRRPPAIPAPSGSLRTPATTRRRTAA